MTIHLKLSCRHLVLSPVEQALAKAAASRQAMRFQFQTQTTGRLAQYFSAPALQIREDTLKRMVSKYSEQMIYRPLEEVQYWFTYSSGAFLEPGYPPLFYNRSENRTVTPSKSAVAGIGEGIAGFLVQRLYQCRKLARPNHDYPDIVMEGNGKTYLVEAKATTQSLSDIRQILDDEITRMAAYVSACSELDHRPVIGVVVGTALASETHYDCWLTEVTV